MNFARSDKVNRTAMSIDVEDTSRNIGIQNTTQSVKKATICPYCKKHVSKLHSGPAIERAAQMGIIPMLEQMVMSGPDIEPKDDEGTVCPQCGYKGKPVDNKCSKCDAEMVIDMQEADVAEAIPGMTEDVVMPMGPDGAEISIEELLSLIMPQDGNEEEGVLIIQICEGCLNRAIELAGGKGMAKMAEATDNLLYCQTCGHSEIYDGGEKSRKCPVCDVPGALNLLPPSEEMIEDL